MSAPKWEEWGRLVLSKLNELEKKVDKIPTREMIKFRSALYGAIAGAVGALVISVLPHKEKLLEIILRTLAG